MKIVLLFAMSILISMVNALISHPIHDFVTLDTVTDRDFAPLLSGDWTQRLP